MIFPQLGKTIEWREVAPVSRDRDNLYSEENLAKKKEGGEWNNESDVMAGEEEEKINGSNENFGPMDGDPGPGARGMENDIRPILETDFSYTYSPIVHGPKWYPTMVSMVVVVVMVVM